MFKRVTILTAVALCACGASATPNTPGSLDGTPDDAGATIINKTANLRAYPGATNIEITEDGLDTRTYFDADATLAEVYAYYHAALEAEGWQRTDLEEGEIEADYERDGRVLEIEVETDDERDFEVEIDIDGDNDDF